MCICLFVFTDGQGHRSEFKVTGECILGKVKVKLGKAVSFRRLKSRT